VSADSGPNVKWLTHKDCGRIISVHDSLGCYSYEPGGRAALSRYRQRRPPCHVGSSLGHSWGRRLWRLRLVVSPSFQHHL